MQQGQICQNVVSQDAIKSGHEDPDVIYISLVRIVLKSPAQTVFNFYLYNIYNCIYVFFY